MPQRFHRIAATIFAGALAAGLWISLAGPISFAGFDESNHLGRLALFGRWISCQGPSPLPTQPPHWPPAWYLTALTALRLTGSHRAVSMVSVVCLLLSIFAAWRAASRIALHVPRGD